MDFLSNKVYNDILQDVPDFTSWEKARVWLKKGLQAVQTLSPSLMLHAEIVSMEWADIEQESDGFFGCYSSEHWRKFVLATFLADLISYPNTVDQVNFDRLLFVMHGFPQGFRIWWINISNQLWVPAGYTGWYPMNETMFELLKQSPERLRGRMVVPATEPNREKSYLYLFNYSAAPMFKHSSFSKRLMERYAEDIKDQQADGLACITVSEDGARMAIRFQMSFTGYLNSRGTTEKIYVRG